MPLPRGTKVLCTDAPHGIVAGVVAHDGRCAVGCIDCVQGFIDSIGGDREVYAYDVQPASGVGSCACTDCLVLAFT